MMNMTVGFVNCTLVIVVVCVCYHNSLWCGFVFDDASAIKDNKDLRPETPVQNLFWNDFWGTPMHKERSHKSYRPLCVLTFRFNYLLQELEPMGYHLVNLVLHAVVCVMFYRFCENFACPKTSLIAALLFAVHPIHTEAVTGVVGRAELLSSIFYLLALSTFSAAGKLKFSTDWLKVAATIVLVTVAMLCKEQGITVVAVCAVHEVFIIQKVHFEELVHIVKGILQGHTTFPSWLRPSVTRVLVLAVSMAMLLLARIKVMGAQLPIFTKFDNPACMASTPARQLTLNYLLPVNVWLLLCPSGLCCDWTMGTIPLIESLLDVRNLATLLFYFGFGRLVIYALKERGKRVRALIMCLALMVLPYIPASNIFFPVGFVVAERILYTPSMGFCLLVAIGFEQLCNHQKNMKPVLYILMSLLLMTHSLKTIVRNRDWESEYALFKAALKVNQRNAKLFNNVGHALENEKNFADALNYFEQAARVQPDDIGAHINVGRALKELQQPAEAEAAYRRALDLMPPVKPGQSYTTRIAPNHLNVFINLGNLISKNESRLLEADSLYRTAISMRSDFIQAYINRGDILMKLNRVTEAKEQYEIALRYEDDNPDLYYNLGVVHLEQNKKVEAFHFFEKALKFNPSHKQTLFNSAVLMQEFGDPKLRPEANKRLKRLQEVEPENEKVYFNLGMLAMDEKNYVAAKDWYDKAIQLKPDFRSALFNVALMLNNDMGQPLEAMMYLKQLLQHHPTHTKGLILMGDIHINHLKDLDAAENNFQTILQMEPKNVQAQHNLCVVYVERGDLFRAEKCLVEAQMMAPQEAYIKQHLEIVRTRIQRAQQAHAQKHEEKRKQTAEQSTQTDKEVPIS